jgi:predicted alpha/beta hydrolase
LDDYKCKQLVDQSGHAIYAVLVLLPVVVFPGSMMGLIGSALIMGFIREWEQWRRADNLHLGDRILDITFFGVGAFLLGLIVNRLC